MAKDIPLVLSGHTHAGQITVAGLHELILTKSSAINTSMVLWRFDPSSPKGAVYVSAGIGAAVMPIRMGEKGKREVAIFELGAQKTLSILFSGQNIKVINLALPALNKIR